MQRHSHIRKDVRWAAILLLLVAGHFWFPKFGEGTGRDTYSYSNEGKKAFYDIVKAVTDAPSDVSRNTQPLIKVLNPRGRYVRASNEDVLCLLGPARYPNVAEWDRILDWVNSGGHLLIAANDRKPAFRIEKLGIQVKRMREIDVDGDAITSNLIPRGRIVWKSNARIAGHRGEVLLSAAGTTQAIQQQHGQGAIVVVASDFVFTNQSIKFVDDNLLLSVALLERAAGIAGNGNFERDYIFDEALNISGTPKVVGLLLNPLFKPMFVQFLIAIVLFAWWRSRRFGPLLPESTTARQNIVDHTDAVGMLLFKTGDGTAALRAYLRQLFAELNLKMHRGREERVLEPLAYKLGKDPELIKRLLQRAVKATKQPQLDRREAAHLLRQLAVIRRAAMQRGGPQRKGDAEPAAPPPPLPAAS